MSPTARKLAATLSFSCIYALTPKASAQANGAAIDCDSPRNRDGIGCITPREGTISGGYIALDLGLITLKDATKQRIEAGAGVAAQFRLGMEFWDILLAGIGIGFGQPNDHAPFSERVMRCDTVNGTVISCDGAADLQESVVKVPFFNLEVGAQNRFRPFANSSITPGIALGHSFGLGPMVREVNCSGCRSEDLDASAAGTYLAPFLRITFGRSGYAAVVVRSAWYLNGDLQQLTTVGGEFGLP